MKRLTLILTILIAAASCTQLAADAPKRQGWDYDKFGPLYGNVESVTITSYFRPIGQIAGCDMATSPINTGDVAISNL